MNGKLSISRFSGHECGISIELQDDTSRVRVIRIEIAPEQWGNVISGLSHQECSFELGKVELVGMVHEHKSELVTTKRYSFSDFEKKAAVAEFEVDGWKAYLPDLGNMHKAVHGKGFNVGFHRHVPNTDSPTP